MTTAGRGYLSPGPLVLLGLLLWENGSVRAENQGLTTGGYAGTMGAGAATAAEPIAFGQNPAALRPPTSGAFRAGFQLDFHHPYGLEDLRVSDAGAFCDFARAGLGISWRETGVEDLYREEALVVNPRFRLGPSRARFPGQLDVGGSWNFWRTEIPGDATRWQAGQGYGIVWRPVPRLKLGAYVQDLPWPGSASTADPVWQVGLEARSREANAKTDDNASGKSWPVQTLHLDFRKTGDLPWRALGALTLALHPSFLVSAGLSTPPFQLSLGIRVGWGGLSWNQAFRYHRYLGRTSLSGLAYAHDYRR